jgi:hypothetical protein
MSDVTWRIVLEDEGGTAEDMAERPGPSLRAQNGSGKGSSSTATAGPKKDSQHAIDSLTTAAGKLSNAIGAGGLFNVSKQLVEAFNDLYASVTSAGNAIDKSDDKAKSSAKRESPKGPAKTASPAGEPAEPEAPPVIVKPSPPIPKVGTFERQFAKGDIEGPPQTAAVAGPVPNVGWWEKQAAKGTPAAPPIHASNVAMDAEIVGPAAGAGAEGAGGLASLSAAAGPLAIAFAAATAAVVAGGIAVKKFVDGMHSETERLARNSAQLSGALARSDIRAEFADLRRAQKVGPELSRFEDNRGRAQEVIQDAFTEGFAELMKRLDKFDPLIDVGIDASKSLVKHIPTIIKLVELASPILAQIEFAADNAKDIASLIRWWLWMDDKEKEKGLTEDPFIAAFLGQFAGGRNPAQGGGAAGGGGIP